MDKLTALFDLFRKGSEVANPEAWKTGQIAGNTLGFFIVALVGVLNAYGYPLPVDSVTAMAIGGGLATVFNSMFTIVTSARAGLPAKVPPVSLPDADPVGTNWVDIAARDFPKDTGGGS